MESALAREPAIPAAELMASRRRDACAVVDSPSRALPQTGDVMRAKNSHLRSLRLSTERGLPWQRRRRPNPRRRKAQRNCSTLRSTTAVGLSVSRGIRTFISAGRDNLRIVPTASCTGAWHSSRPDRGTNQQAPLHLRSRKPRRIVERNTVECEFPAELRHAAACDIGRPAGSGRPLQQPAGYGSGAFAPL